jgi:hypothetical protein
MVNLGLNWSSLLGIILAVAGAGLYFLRSWRPKLARDHDIFFAAVGLLCGGILLFQGWRLDPILAFGQFLLTGSAIFFAAESQDYRSSRESYDDEPRRRPSNRNGSVNTSRPDSPDRASRKRPSRPEAPPAQESDNWDVSDNPEERPTRSRSSRPPASENRSSDTPPRTKKPRPTEASRSRPSNRDVEAPPSDYVEYRPVEYPEDQPDNSPSFDK